MKKSLAILFAFIALLALRATAQQTPQPAPAFQPVPELPYQVEPNFFKFPPGTIPCETSAIAVNSKGHIFLFRRAKPMLSEFDAQGNFIRSIDDGLFTHPHGLRIDAGDNIWITDDVAQLVLKLDPNGNVLLVLGRTNLGAEGDWVFNRPTDVAFGKNGEIYVADGYGNSRIVKFDRDGNFIKAWGKYGSGPGEFDIPHSVVVDNQGLVYVADRENQRIQIFDADGNFLRQWTGIGYPYGLLIDPDQHIWMVDGGFDRVVEFDLNGKILGAFGEPGHKAGQLAWGHFLAMGPDQTIYVADPLNWRFDVYAHTAPTGKMTTYMPSQRMYWTAKPSIGWYELQTDLPLK
jgi:DNA-binding beta-propeller fold protein YncE